MAQEINKPLDTSELQQAYPHEATPTHERFGEGERYTFGSTLADVYSNPPELTPVVYVRMVKGYLAVGDVLHVLPTEAGGLHVDHANGACEISKTGDVASVYTPPSEFRLSQEGGNANRCVWQKLHANEYRNRRNAGGSARHDLWHT